MLNITSIRCSTGIHSRLPRVAIVAGRDQRAVVKRILAGSAEIVAELESDARVHLLHAVDPDIVFIDTESPRVNPFTASNLATEIGPSVRIVLLCREQSTAAAILRRIPTSASVVTVHPYAAASVLPVNSADGSPRQGMTPPVAA